MIKLLCKGVAKEEFIWTIADDYLAANPRQCTLLRDEVEQFFRSIRELVSQDD